MPPTTPRARDLVTFHCGGKPYALKIDYLRIKTLADRTGKTPLQLLGDEAGGWPELLAESLRHQHYKITVADACALMTEWLDEDHELSTLGELLMECLIQFGYLKKPTQTPAGELEGKATGLETP